MKLNTKRTILTGFAFFLICAFWQAYDSIIPKILTDKFGLNQFWSGLLMALDNVLAVFLLPIFGSLSDRCTTKRGRRTPFILWGTVAAAVFLISLSGADMIQLNELSAIEAVTDETDAGYGEAMDTLYHSGVTITAKKDGVSGNYTLPELYTAEEFVAIRPGTDTFTNVVIPARQAYAWQATVAQPFHLVLFIVLLLLVLLSMATFRSPAVALMPDVTPKPLRSKGNAIINLMGSTGGILVLGLGIAFGTGKSTNALMSYNGFFFVVAMLMLVALLVFLCTVKEPKWAAEAEALCPTEEAEPEENTNHGGELSKGEKRSLYLILASVVLWYCGYNAVTSKYSVYAGQILGLDFNMTLIIAQAAAIVSYIPVGVLSAKFGRKKMILTGVALLGISFFFASFMREGSSLLVMNILFAMAGIGWATINVNSYPMAVELAKAGDVGKYTGYYYTASMSAQILTPMVSGALMTVCGMTCLFPYAAIFVGGAAVTMALVKHGDSKPTEKKSLLENLDIDD